MKVIFLDIDGVLNCAKTTARRNGIFWFDQKHIARFNKILKAIPKVEIVLSSSWREVSYLSDINKWLREEGLSKDLHSETPSWHQMPNNSSVRGKQIQEWIDQHETPEKFVIVDDASDMAHLMSYLVQTTWEEGLQDSHVNEIISRLKS